MKKERGAHIIVLILMIVTSIFVTNDSLAQPTITSHPLSTSVCLGSNATFTVGVSGTSPFTYKWQQNTGAGFADLTNGGGFSGVTTATLRITTPASSMNNYSYRCKITNGAGTVTSNSATLTVMVNVVITAQPPVNTSVCSGGNTSICVTATGSSLTYQWYYTIGAGWLLLANGSEYSNVTSNCLTLTGVSSNTLKIYSCLISSGGCSLRTNQANLVLNPLPSITSQPADASVCLNGNTNFKVTASGSSLSYQWQENSGAGFSNLSDAGVYAGTTLATMTITAAPGSLNGYQYRCIVSNACGPSTSNTAILAVNTIPVITVQPTDAIVCNGSNTSYSISAAGTNLTYQWKATGGAGFHPLTEGGYYSGTTAGSLNLISVSNQALPTGTYLIYRCVVSSAGCASVNSNQINLTIKPNTGTASVSVTPSATTICPGTTVNFTATPGSGGATPSYKWRLNGVDISGATNVNFSSSSINNNDSISCLMTSSISCPLNSPASDVKRIAVNPVLLASIRIMASSNNVCPGTMINFAATPTNGGSLPVYQWHRNNTLIPSANKSVYSSNSLASGDIIKCLMTSDALPCLIGSPAASNEDTVTLIPKHPVNTTIANITTSTANINWNSGCSVSRWQTRRSVLGANSWVYASVDSNFRKLSNMEMGTTYEAQVRAIYGPGDTSVWSDSKVFTTQFFCYNVTGLNTSNITSSSAQLNWINEIQGGKRIWYRSAGASSWNVALASLNATKNLITGLTPGTTYEWQVRTSCFSGTDISEWSGLQHFTTAASRTGEEIRISNSSALIIYPNPGEDIFNIQTDLSAEGKSLLTVTDMLGNEIFQDEIYTQKGAFTGSVDLSGKAPGTYFVCFKNKEGIHTARLFKK